MLEHDDLCIDCEVERRCAECNKLICHPGVGPPWKSSEETAYIRSQEYLNQRVPNYLSYIFAKHVATEGDEELYRECSTEYHYLQKSGQYCRACFPRVINTPAKAEEQIRPVMRPMPNRPSHTISVPRRPERVAETESTPDLLDLVGGEE